MKSSTLETMRSLIYEALREVYDPELGVNVVDLGLVYNIDITEDGFVTITMTLTTPGCPMHESLAEGVGAALGDIPGLIGGEIRLVWNPLWSPERMTEEGKRQLGFL
ncbi:MAG TPA: metal-sulfur cluster assembly factor [Ktedonobacteraceae bacterium]|nr:metal-sulfur cluster assembly factor [Ktedonobacteraceae bacterium]